MEPDCQPPPTATDLRTSPVRRRAAGRGAALAAAALAVAVAACGSAGSDSGPGTGAAAAGGSPGRAIEVSGRAGETLTLRASPPGSTSPGGRPRLRVTVRGVRGPFSGFDAGAGREVVGVDLRVANAGTGRYEEPQLHGALVLAGGRSGRPTSLITGLRANPCVTPRLVLRHGQTRTLCVAFDVPAGARPRAFRYTADFGLGDTGIWRLR